MGYRSIPGGGGGLAATGSAGLVADVNVVEVAGTAVVGTGVNGIMPVAGDVADDDTASASYPIKIGAVADETLSLVADGDMVHLITDLYRRLRTLPEGAIADDAEDTAALNPLKMGAVADETLSLVADRDMVHLITDLYRRLQVVTAGYSTLLDAIRVSVLNTIADDRDPDYQTWADVTDLSADTYYYPSSNGHEVGNRDNIGFQVELDDGTFTVEVSNDRSTWVDATMNLVDSQNPAVPTASYGGAAVTANYALSWEKCEFQYIRVKWVTPDATNDLEVHVYTRSH